MTSSVHALGWRCQSAYVKDLGNPTTLWHTPFRSRLDYEFQYRTESPVQRIPVGRGKLDYVLAETSFEKRRTCVDALAIPSEVVIGATMLFRPSNRMPLQQVASAQPVNFGGRAKNVPGPGRRPDHQGTAQQTCFIKGE
jgi:hypothetical protein